MRFLHREIRWQTAAAAGALLLSLAAPHDPARAEDKTYVMKLGTATINEAQHQWCKDFVAMVQKDSGGRIKGEIYPASQLGRSRARSRAFSSAPFRAMSVRPSFWSASMPATK